METLNLPLYPQIETTPKLPDKLIKEAPKRPFYAPNPQTPLENAINSLFPTEEEESKIARMRGHLGETAKDLSDTQVETIITEFQFLIDTWLDEYEKEVFSGLTLKDVLNGG